MNDTATGRVQNAHWHYYSYGSYGGSSGMSVSTIVGIIFASVGGVIIVISLVCIIVQCCRKAQQQQVAQGAEVTYPSATQPPYATTMNGGGYDMQQMGSNAAAMMPPTAVQPAITPLGVPGGNPYSPNGANYAYGTPMGAAPPPQPANEYGNGVYYQRAPEALVEPGTPAQPQHAGTAPLNPNDSAVYYFKDWN